MSGLFLLIFAAGLVQTASNGWPAITETSKSINVRNVDDPNEASLDLIISTIGGDPAYSLTCHSADFESEGVEYSGLMQCYLFSLGPRDKKLNLLNDSAGTHGRAWQNRGRFLAFHLSPDCASFPEWGAVRNFRLRGMEITLSMSDVAFVADNIKGSLAKSYKFSVSVVPAPKEMSDLSRSVSTPEPDWFYGNHCPAKKISRRQVIR